MTNYLEFTVIGDTVNVAARLEALTKEMGCPILVSEACYEQLQRWILVPLGEVPIRGRDEKIEVYTLPWLG